MRTINDIKSEILGKEKSPKHSQKEMKGYTVLSEVTTDTHPWSTAKWPKHTIFSPLIIVIGP
jgi:hypothetical protein